MSSNTALTDELEAVNSIYDTNTLTIVSSDDVSTATILTLPNLPFSFSITFPYEYPDIPPQIDGTQSTGPDTKIGEGEAALNILRGVLGNIYTPGQVCLFDLVEEVTPLLQTSSQDKLHDGPSQDHTETSTYRSAINIPSGVPDLSNLHVKDLASDPSLAAASIPEPDWKLSQPLLVNKSTFVARALHVNNLSEATSSISHLLATNKKVAGATHNITAWRIKSRINESAPETTIQDCDDDGETAAGGRLLHLMQLMDVWNVVVVVTRWYGGVKLGADRFRCINMVARDALLTGGFAKAETDSGGKGKGKKR